MKKCDLFLFFVLLIPQILSAQDQWIYYTNDNYPLRIAVEKNYVWAASGLSGYGIIRWDKNTGEYKRFTINDGLPANSIFDVAIDNLGNKWFGTTSDLAKFDGFKWTTYGRKDGLGVGYVRIIQTVPNGPYWFVTLSGVTKYTGTNWFNYTTKDGLASTYISSFAAGYSNQAWAALIANDHYFLSKYDGNTWTSMLPKDISPVLAAENDGAVISLYLDKFGKLWIGSNKGVIVYNGTNCIQYTTENGLSDNVVTGITSENDERFWFSTRNGVSSFDGTTWTSYTSKDGLSNDRVWETAIDSDGNKWFATNGGGLCCFDGAKWKTYKTDNWLPYPGVDLAAADRKGNMWVALSNNMGICRYDGTKATAYKPGERIGANPVKAIAVDSANNVWFAYGDAGGGVTKFDGQDWTNYSSGDGLGGSNVYAIAVDRDNSLWFGTNYGVSRFDGKTWMTYRQTDGLIYDDIRAIAFDAQGNKWFGSSVKGVSKFDGKTWTNYTKDNGLFGNYITCIKAEDNGTVWVCCLGGISRFDGMNWVTITDSSAANIASYGILKIEIDNAGNKWFAAQTSVYKFDGQMWRKYTTADGLMDNYGFDITKDLQGNLWIVGMKGISKFNIGKPSAINEEDENMSMEFSLAQNYPNPFNPTTTIRFNTPREGYAIIKIYNILGQEVKIVISEQLSAGNHEVQWDGTDRHGRKVSSGIYIYRLETESGHSQTRKMVYLK